MITPVLVRGSSGTLTFVLSGIVSVIAFVIAAILGAGKHSGPATLFVGIGIVSALIGLIVGFNYNRKRRIWVTDTGNGFVALDNGGERTFSDSQVLGSALGLKRNYVNGTLKSLTRTFVVWLSQQDGPPEKMTMTNKLPLTGDDPLSDLINRLNEGLYQRALSDRAGRRPVLGEKWRLAGQELTVFDGDQELMIKMDDIVAVDHVDSQIHLWIRGQDEAWAKMPAASVNAPLLSRLVGEQIADRPPETVTTNQLGRLIFERRSKRGTIVALGVLAAVAGVVSLGMAIVALLGSMSLMWGALGVGIFAVLLVWGMFYSINATFRCHQNGVVKRGLKTEKSMFYRNMSAFTYSATRHYHNGAYTGTVIELKFEAGEGAAKETVSYTTHIQGDDPTLDHLREHVSRILASQMSTRLAAGEPVTWTNHLRYLPAALEYKPTKWFRTSEPILIPYSDIRSFNMDDGSFNMWTANEKKATVREAISEKNFFPGYYLLLAMMSPADTVAPTE